MVAVAFLGFLGSGKTTMAVRDTILTKKLHPNKTIYSNMVLYNYDYKDLDLMDMYLNHQTEKDIIILGDEVYTMMDSRLSQSNRNKVESYFMAMSRKKDCDFFMTMQYEKFVDCRIAPFIQIKYIMESIPIVQKTFIDGIEYSYTIPHPYLFKVHLFDNRIPFNTVTKDFVFDGRRWFKEFNTYQTILPPEDIQLSIKLNLLKKKVQYEKLLIKEKELNDLKNNDNKKKLKKN